MSFNFFILFSIVFHLLLNFKLKIDVKIRDRDRVHARQAKSVFLFKILRISVFLNSNALKFLIKNNLEIFLRPNWDVNLFLNNKIVIKDKITQYLQKWMLKTFCWLGKKF